MCSLCLRSVDLPSTSLMGKYICTLFVIFIYGKFICDHSIIYSIIYFDQYGPMDILYCVGYNPVILYLFLLIFL